MKHLDLFNGIGGFAYAVDQVWPGSTHVFCDNNKFCQKVLAKHWPGSVIYDDIKTITNTEYQRPVSPNYQERTRCKKGIFEEYKFSDEKTDLLTGGFPCQPFSQAGKRKGTADDRYLWPEMFRVIQLTKPAWIIAENVRGLVTWNEGMVLEQVCADLEAEGYEVQPLIIPACAVNAPHRRDRIWIVAHNPSKRLEGCDWTSIKRRTETDWSQDWLKVATKFCSLDDGLPVELGEFKLTKAEHRTEQLKAYGNAIVPQVAIQIMSAIRTNYDPIR